MDNHTHERRHMPIKCATVYQNRIWISSYLYNALYCYDCAENNMKYLGNFENQDQGDNLHRQIIRSEDILFFIPICADGIDVYNIKEQHFENTIKCCRDKKLTNRIALQISDEIVWLFPQNIKESLYVLYATEKRIECFIGWEKEINKTFANNETYLISASGICADEKNVYVAIYNQGFILKIDKETLKIQKIFSDEKYHFASVNYLDGVLYLTEIGSSGIVQVEGDNVINKIENREFNDVSIPYCGMVRVKNGFLVMPYHLNEFYFLDIKKKILQKTDIRFNKEESSEPCFFNWQIYEGNVFLYPMRAQSILIINSENLDVREIDLRIPDDITDQWILKNKFEVYCSSRNGILNETNFRLEEFIMLLKNERKIVAKSAECIGKEIYTSVNRKWT